MHHAIRRTIPLTQYYPDDPAPTFTPNPNPKPDWLSWAPVWTWSYAFPNNVNGVYGPRPAGYIGKQITENDPLPRFEGFGTYLDPDPPAYAATALPAS